MAAAAGLPNANTQTHSELPSALFIENVDGFMKEFGKPTQVLLEALQKDFSRFKSLERRLTAVRDMLKSKIPEIEKTLETIKFLKTKKDAGATDLSTNFELTSGVWSTAKISNFDNVFLWLGANVMVEYPIDEAIAILEENKSGAAGKLTSTQEDLDFIADQIVITQVSMARIHNWDVTKRRKTSEVS
eukprot:TRINITY_DN6823_c0_g1_i1.p1 TRINITY_DN6823_c0_g1~~TRINITY_DN6823_c0_g1_i1.p1  ORF type:complete len:213 (-),score=50.79 TRINITY_DN6823_c0_g1_i1:96-659(-)